MNLIFKRSGSSNYYVSGSRLSTGTADKELALQFAKKHIADSYKSQMLGVIPPRTWGELITAWTAHKAAKRAIDRDISVIADFNLDLEMPLGGITADHIRNYGLVVAQRASPSTANRHLSVIRAMLNFAVKAAWINSVPHVALMEVAQAEFKWMSPDDFSVLVPHLEGYAADFFTLAQQTGLRFSNVRGLRWSWIADGIITVPAQETKTGRKYLVPLSTKAKAIIDRLRLNADSEFVLRQDTYFQYRAIWNRAVKAAGLPSYCIHSLRHLWASEQVKAGVPDRILMALGGWASPAMLERYVHHDPEDLARYVK